MTEAKEHWLHKFDCYSKIKDKPKRKTANKVSQADMRKAQTAFRTSFSPYNTGIVSWKSTSLRSPLKSLMRSQFSFSMGGPLASSNSFPFSRSWNLAILLKNYLITWSFPHHLDMPSPHLHHWIVISALRISLASWIIWWSILGLAADTSSKAVILGVKSRG